ncbi:MAG: Phosphoglycerate mutase [Bacilli bacterium]|nr:Phosphoglycerate mutase [Bacilli bacterium]
MTELIVVRHGVTEPNLRFDLVGWTDPDLHELGMQQAWFAALALQSESLTCAYTSSLKRARQTLDAILTHHTGLSMIASAAFQEIHMGELDGLSSFSAYETHQEILDAALDPMSTDFRWPAGESLIDVHERFLTGLQEVVTAQPDGTVCLVTHGGPIGLWLAHCDHAPLGSFRGYQPAHGSISRIRIGHHPTDIEVVSFNECDHLPAFLSEQIRILQNPIV